MAASSPLLPIQPQEARVQAATPTSPRPSETGPDGWGQMNYGGQPAAAKPSLEIQGPRRGQGGLRLSRVPGAPSFLPWVSKQSGWRAAISLASSDSPVTPVTEPWQWESGTVWGPAFPGREGTKKVLGLGSGQRRVRESELKSEPREEEDMQSSREHLAEGKGRADSPRLRVFVQLSDFH